MGRAKEIELKVLPAKIANEFVKKHHYSGKVVQNSSLHFGAFLDGGLHGVLSFGPSLDKSKIVGLVSGTGWNEFIELNRMAFDEYLPRNSESFCIGKAIRMIKKMAPQIKWIISFADGGQCGDGTIYRASNFVLTGISKCSIFASADGKTKIQQASISARGTKANREALNLQYKNGGGLVEAYCKHYNLKRIEGFSLRYIYFIDKSYRKNLTVPEIPFSKIDEIGAGMYKGERVSQEERHAKKTEKEKKEDV